MTCIRNTNKSEGPGFVKEEKKFCKMIAGFCNPLLDISAHASPELLEKYSLKANDAILASPEHAGLIHDLPKGELVFSAGGAGQNTLRAVQHLLPPGRTKFFGCVGRDEHAKILEAQARKDGLEPCYQVCEGEATGTCICLLTPGCRSLVATLGAANHFDDAKFDAEVELVGVQMIYITGFFCTVSPRTIEKIAEYKERHPEVILAMNLSAPFISEYFSDVQQKLIQASDYIFGNETEALAYARKHQTDCKTTLECAEAIAKKYSRKIIVFTQGAQESIVVKDGFVLSVPVPPVAEVVDTNGAGDCFVGGFLAGLAQSLSLQECVDMGHALAAKIISKIGIHFD